MSKKYNIVIVGSTGAVGVELLKVLEKRNFPVNTLSLLASHRSVGKKQIFKKKEYIVEELKEDSFSKNKYDIAFFSAGGGNSLKYAPLAASSGAIVIDNSSAFRMSSEVPLVIPEINPEALKNHKNIIANPNCSTIILLMAVYPIHRMNPIQKIIVSTYQAASGAGQSAMLELESHAKSFLETGRMPAPQVLKYPLAFNAFSHNSNIDIETGYNEEEIKMVKEAHKILNEDAIPIHPTCIRISTFRAHAESIYLELKNEVNLDECKKVLEKFKGVKVVDDRKNNYFPMPLEVSGEDDIWVGRLRTSMFSEKMKNHSLELWCCGDQILKGAALNAVQIAELL